MFDAGSGASAPRSSPNVPPGTPRAPARAMPVPSPTPPAASASPPTQPPETLLDVSVLRKGDVIPIARIEELMGVSYSERLYSQAAVRVREWVVQESKRLGLNFEAKVLKGKVKVLLDKEVAAYEKKQVQLSAKRIRRSHKQLNTCVDTTNLNNQEKQEYASAQQHVGLRHLQLGYRPPTVIPASTPYVPGPPKKQP